MAKASRANITISEVAKRAHVSIATVSRVLNSQHTGSQEMRQRVWEAVEALDYKPSEAARTLAVRAGRSMAFVMQPSRPFSVFFSDVLKGAEDEAGRHQYEIYFTTDHRPMGVAGSAGRPKGIGGHPVVGMLYAGEIPGDFLQEVQTAGIPLVHVNSYSGNGNIDCVMCDNQAASYKAVRWLAGLGHRRIACIACNYPANVSIKERVGGYLQALFDEGIALEPGWLQHVDAFEPQAGIRAMENILALRPRPTAVFGTVDEVAVGAIQQARVQGLQVPADISVMGVNDLEIARTCNPPLTSVRIHREEMGRVAVRRLVEVIRNPAGKPLRVDVLCDLVERASCMGPAAQANSK